MGLTSTFMRDRFLKMQVTIQSPPPNFMIFGEFEGDFRINICINPQKLNIYAIKSILFPKKIGGLNSYKCKNKRGSSKTF